MAMVNKGFGTTGYKPPVDERVEQSTQNWSQQGASAGADYSATLANRTGSRDAMQDYLAQQTQRQTAVQAVQSAGYNPAQAQQLLSSMQSAAGLAGSMQSGAAGFSPSRTAGFDTQSLKDFQSTNLQGLNFDQLMNYDPSQYGQEYARGAYGEFERNLEGQLRELTERSAGGRMRTGWFDADRGRVVTSNARDFSNALSRAAVDFSGQRLDAIGRASTLGFQRAEAMDSNARQMASLAAELGLRQATDADRMSLEAAMAGDDFAIKRLAQQNGMSEAALRASLQMAEMEMNNAQFNAGQVNQMGRFNAEQAQRQNEFTGGMTRDFYNADRADFQSAADRAAQFASSDMDWSRADRSFEYQRQQDAERRELANAEMARQGYLDNTYIYTDPLTGRQSRRPVGSAPAPRKLGPG